MENSICLDTDIVSDFMRNKSEAVEWVNSHDDSNLCITIITVFELYYGAYKSKNQIKSKNAVDSVLNHLEVLDLSQEDAREAGEQLARLVREGKVIEFRDALIGAISLNNKIPLKTRNISHFERIKGLKLID